MSDKVKEARRIIQTTWKDYELYLTNTRMFIDWLDHRTPDGAWFRIQSPQKGVGFKWTFQFVNVPGMFENAVKFGGSIEEVLAEAVIDKYNEESNGK